MEIVKAIDSKLIEEWEKKQEEADQLQIIILNRITFILNTWFGIFNKKLNGWVFQDPDTYDFHSMSLKSCLNDDYIINIETHNPLSGNFIDKFDKEFYWRGEIPTRWLFDDGFEKEIRDGKELLLKRKEERKLANEKAKADKLEELYDLACAAEAKLTKEELAALKKKFK